MIQQLLAHSQAPGGRGPAIIPLSPTAVVYSMVHIPHLDGDPPVNPFGSTSLGPLMTGTPLLQLIHSAFARALSDQIPRFVLPEAAKQLPSFALSV